MRKLFHDYRAMRAEIEHLRSIDPTVSDLVKGSSSEAPYTQHSVRIRGIDRQYANWIKERIESLSALCAEVEAATALAPASIRLILMLRFHQGLDWEDIADQIPTNGRGERPDGASVKKRVERYLKELPTRPS